MVEELTKHENQVYAELVKEHNNSGLYKICSIDQFIKSKWENEKNDRKASTY